MRNVTHCLIVAVVFVVMGGAAFAQSVDQALQAKIDARVVSIKAMAADPVIVQAVKAGNAATAPEYAGMTQDKWAGLSVLDPLVRDFTRNDAATVLKNKKTEEISEAFVSTAAGLKVAFLSKPSNWSHKGKPKHDVPMSGKTWQGPIEVDASTGVQQIQVAVPVLDSGKPVGSLVVGLAVSKMR